jgi:hypothetical protein
MALTAAQIVTLACQIAKCPGYTSQAGQFLNTILQELCQDYDLDLAKTTYTLTFNSGGYSGAGPYPLPSDFLRPKFDTVTYTTGDGVPFKMKQIDDAKFVEFLRSPAVSSGYPEWFRINNDVAPKTIEVYPPAAGSYVVLIPYQRQMPDISTPESSNTVPWFINQTWLVTRLAGELMKITGDQRLASFLGDDDNAYPQGAGTILRRYLKMKDSDTGFAKTVNLDPRFFKTGRRVKNTKLQGW